MQITVCVGSACHQRGSHQVIEYLQGFISKNQLQDEIILKASFCLGHCAEGFNLEVDGEIKNFATIQAMSDWLTQCLVQRTCHTAK